MGVAVGGNGGKAAPSGGRGGGGEGSETDANDEGRCDSRAPPPALVCKNETFLGGGSGGTNMPRRLQEKRSSTRLRKSPGLIPAVPAHGSGSLINWDSGRRLNHGNLKLGAPESVNISAAQRFSDALISISFALRQSCWSPLM